MAKTSKPSKSARAASRPGPQAPPGVWTPAALSDALHRGTIEEKVALLRTIGILDAKGDLARKYRTWGSKVTRTPEEPEDAA